MTAPDIIQTLVKRFDDNLAFYKSKKYNEAQLRQEFLDPFFEALGWDVYNKKDYAPRYREVIVEKPISFQGSQSSKTPDYTFRLGEDPKFFVEAKRPSENLETSSEFAFQLKAYAWNKHLPLSILTDFEEFLVFDCRRKPTKTDRPDVDCIMKLTYTDYLEKWDELTAIFSPNSIRKGAFDKYAEDNTSKKGVSEVDDEFLNDISTWRELLARNIALRNKESIDESCLNYAVQMTIDRIIFLRICEDRGIEPFNQLRELTEKPDIYQDLQDLFKRAELKFNSGLFTFNSQKNSNTHQDNLTPSLSIDDKVLKEIITDLYYPKSTYNFKAIPVEILGQVYEQFLGKVIRLTPGHQAKIEEKPEVRKAGGVYYTPKYIVDYIVANTVGKLLEGKTPEEASKLRIVDPACGSGSFLLGAFQYLMDWHEDWYFSHEPEKWSRGKEPTLAPVDGGDFRLSTPEKKRILINNIYGVDIDSQAVEVTKLSLLLKVLEEETGQLSLGFEHVLPDLGNNIKCGNSLIGWDYFEGQLILDEKEVKRVNPFDWQKSFPQVFEQGGFNAVIGNPPYIRIQMLREWAPTDVNFYNKSFNSATKGNYDIYVIFIEKGLEILNPTGHLGFILPHKFFNAHFAGPVRNLISLGNHLEKIVHFGSEQVFENATTYTCLLFLNKSPQENFLFASIEENVSIKEFLNHEISIENNNFHSFPPGESEWHFFDSQKQKVINSLNKQTILLGDVTRKIFQGIATSADNVFVLKYIRQSRDKYICYSKEMGIEIEIEPKLLKPFLMGKDVHRYEPLTRNNYVIFPYEVNNEKFDLLEPSFIKSEYPEGWKYLINNKEILSKRENGRYEGKYFYAFSRPQNMVEFSLPKIVTPEIALGCQMTLDEDGAFYHTTKVYSFVFKNCQSENTKYWLGVLNSKPLWYFLKSTGYVLRGGFFTFKTNYLNPFPVRTIDFNKTADKKHHEHMIDLVEHILDLHKRTPQTPHEQERLQREISATDAQIDRLVYDLYGLTEEEIRIVEGK